MQTPAWQQAAHDPTVMADPVNQAVVAAVSDPTSSGGILAQVQNDSSVITQMNPVFAHPFQAGFSDSMDTVFLFAAGVSVLAFLVLLLMPKVELRARSASAERAAEAAGPVG